VSGRNIKEKADGNEYRFRGKKAMNCDWKKKGVDFSVVTY
jgi:hypothetical protein